MSIEGGAAAIRLAGRWETEHLTSDKESTRARIGGRSGHRRRAAEDDAVLSPRDDGRVRRRRPRRNPGKRAQS